MRYSILIVDDDKLVNEFLVEAVKRMGYDCKAVYSGEEAIVAFKEKEYDIVLSDLKMKEIDGVALLKHIKKLAPETVFIIMTAFGSVETAVKAIKNGAYDFLLKPVGPENLQLILNRVTEMLTLRTENEIMKRDLSTHFQNIIGKSRVMRDVFDLIQSVANARSTVLITGASGSGKEMVARAIHYASNRSDKPFIKLNCAALPDSLVEAELFGYEKGAFTDAKKMHRGRFELADNGTLLLDEITEMPLNLQSKLLRVIQEREFERIGSTETITVNVRLLATSNQNLKEAIAMGKFREDLYYRLNVIPMQLCSLEERKEDIPLLVKHFIDKYNKENDLKIEGVDDAVLKMLLKYHWPGNVRELENCIERAVVISKDNILTDDLFPVELTLGRLMTETSGLSVPMKLEEGTKILILKTLEKFNGNKTKAAEALGITPRTIRNKLAEYDLIDL